MGGGPEQILHLFCPRLYGGRSLVGFPYLIFVPIKKFIMLMTPIDVRYSAIIPDFKIFTRHQQLMYTKVNGEYSKMIIGQLIKVLMM